MENQFNPEKGININHDPEGTQNLDPNKGYIDESDGELTAEQREDRIHFLQDLNSVKVYDQNGEVDYDKTKAERERYIKEKHLADTDKYAPRFEIGEDEKGLPIRILKK